MRKEEEIRKELQDLEKVRLKISKNMERAPNIFFKQLDANLLLRTAAKMETLYWILGEECDEL